MTEEKRTNAQADTVVLRLAHHLEETASLLALAIGQRDREARDAANARAENTKLAEHIVELNDEIAALRDLHAAGGGE